MKEIPLTQGLVAVVDDEDHARLCHFKWYASQNRSTVYAGRWVRTALNHGTTVLMHREVMQAPPGMLVDHIDGNGLNNCRSNLRLATHSENQYNKRPSTHAKKSAPGLKGVAANSSRWTAAIECRGKRIYIGSFRSAEDAAAAYNAKAKELFGEFARLNVLTMEAA